ncbi:zinc-dependent alcohol dehydrogenase [Acidicapsa ligni]|uniref:zinc-dependent alcohol dehydrogenase n=1 Tax=Acidicapsa ligni TaxID=542300 RepID=UPI0021DF885F|nr:alcohol dehydrogenase catalytic domain-containing protein [Acidicapsa ligni]
MSTTVAITTMTAAVLYGKEDVRIEQVPVPHAAPGELIVRVVAALTCGTDLKIYRRGYHARMIQPPALFGHEVSGIVVEIGDGVTNFAVGDRVVPLNSAPCGKCYFCLRDQENLCEDLLFNNGAYAEFIRVPARIVAKNTLLIPKDVPLEYAALTEPLACALHGFEDSSPRPGDTVAVIGGGPLGLMILHVAALAGCKVIAVVKRNAQVEAARSLGAAHVIQTTDVTDVAAAVCALTPNQRGVDIAIEAVALPETWHQAVAMVRNGGVVNFFGGPAAGTEVSLDTNRLHYGDLTLKATFHHTPAICRQAFALIASGEFNAERFITGHAPLSELNAVFTQLLDRGNDIKTAILPGMTEIER